MKKIILECIVGSTVHGTNVQDGLEDLDLMAIAIETQEQFFSGEDVWTHRTKPQGVRSEAGDVDWVCYGLAKYVRLALKGNPTILLALFAEPRVMTTEGKMLREFSSLIVSKQAAAPFLGYMQQQTERLMGSRGQKRCTRPELVEKYGYDTKYAGHIVRLALQGRELMETGKISLPMRPNDRQLVVDVRTGAYTLEQVDQMIFALRSNLLSAIEKSPLPEHPQREVVERWMRLKYLRKWLDDLQAQEPAGQ
jgi:predicted nucleotidyltransferase